MHPFPTLEKSRLKNGATLDLLFQSLKTIPKKIKLIHKEFNYLPEQNSTFFKETQIPAHNNTKFKILIIRTSLVPQWLGVHLPMQGTGVPSLVQEDPTCHEATKPVNHNY